MHKAAELAAKLEQVDMANGADIIEAFHEHALKFVMIGDANCMMHSDGSANIFEFMGEDRIAVEIISPENILRVLAHYRPFKEVFKNKVQ